VNDVVWSNPVDAVAQSADTKNERVWRYGPPGGQLEEHRDDANDVTQFMGFLGVYEAESVARWPTALAER